MNPEERLFAALAEAGKAAGGKLTREQWLTVAGKFLAKEYPPLMRKRKKSVLQLTEEEWIAELEHDPVFAGIDVRRELGKCQFWCKTNGKQCSRRRFANWLNKAERTVGANYAGSSSRVAVKVDTAIEPDGWRAFAEKLWPGSLVPQQAWFSLDSFYRLSIIKAML